MVSFQSHVFAGTATLTVQNTMTLGRGTHSTRGDLQIKWLIVIQVLAVAPRALRGLEECLTQPTPTTTRATLSPSTSIESCVPLLLHGGLFCVSFSSDVQLFLPLMDHLLHIVVQCNVYFDE